MEPNKMKSNQTASSWLEIDIVGLRRTPERKGKAWAIFELVQNAWDTDATRVDVILTKPNKNGMSTLTCRDNAPDGYRDLSEAHTLFASSSKKADPTKRRRFNAGEKFVLVMCESAKVTSFARSDIRVGQFTKWMEVSVILDFRPTINMSDGGAVK